MTKSCKTKIVKYNQQINEQIVHEEQQQAQVEKYRLAFEKQEQQTQQMLKNVMENSETNDNLQNKFIVRNRLYHPHAALEQKRLENLIQKNKKSTINNKRITYDKTCLAFQTIDTKLSPKNIIDLPWSKYQYQNNAVKPYQMTDKSIERKELTHRKFNHSSTNLKMNSIKSNFLNKQFGKQEILQTFSQQKTQLGFGNKHPFLQQLSPNNSQIEKSTQQMKPFTAKNYEDLPDYYFSRKPGTCIFNYIDRKDWINTFDDL